MFKKITTKIKIHISTAKNKGSDNSYYNCEILTPEEIDIMIDYFKEKKYLVALIVEGICKSRPQSGNVLPEFFRPDSDIRSYYGAGFLPKGTFIYARFDTLNFDIEESDITNFVEKTLSKEFKKFSNSWKVLIRGEEL